MNSVEVAIEVGTADAFPPLPRIPCAIAARPMVPVVVMVPPVMPLLVATEVTVPAPFPLNVVQSAAERQPGTDPVAVWQVTAPVDEV